VTAKDPTSTNHIHVSTDQERRTLVERAAGQYLDMSVDEYLDAWEHGRFENPDRPEVMRVALLLPVGR
jgi:hypothetical protein